MYYEIKLTVGKEVPCKASKAGATASETKQVGEHYISDCDNVADAYYKTLELHPTCEVKSVAVSKIKEIVNDKVENKPFFKATVTDVFTDDEGNEKENKYYILVCAKDVSEATKLMTEYLSQGYDMQLIAITRTKILDLLC